MASPLDIHASRGEERFALPRLDRDQVYWVVVAAALVVVAGSLWIRSGAPAYANPRIATAAGHAAAHASRLMVMGAARVN